jgi:integrase
VAERLVAELAGTPIYLIARMALLTGLRRCEIVRVRDINFKAKVIVLPEEKNGSEFEERALTPEAMAFLREQVAGKRPDELVFPWSLSLDRISQEFTRVTKRCGLRLSFHSLRKTFATVMVTRVGLAGAMKFTGHLDLRVFDRTYNGLSARAAAAML